MTYSFTLIICIISLFVLVILIIVMLRKKPYFINLHEKYRMKGASLFGKGHQNCKNIPVYCFEDSDCIAKCDTLNEYSCMHGMCKQSVIIAEDDKNKCDPKKGFIGYLIGNTTFGIYEYLCKTIDAEIAVSVNENRMCYNQIEMLDIDYTKAYPSINDCTCRDRVLVPATAQKREHVECNSIFVDLVHYE